MTIPHIIHPQFIIPIILPKKTKLRPEIHRFQIATPKTNLMMNQDHRKQFIPIGESWNATAP
jgi:hypothetical protein